MNTAAQSMRQQVEVCVGSAGMPVGSLTYVKQGRRENSAIAYGNAWLANPARFQFHHFSAHHECSYHLVRELHGHVPVQLCRSLMQAALAA